MFFVKRDTLEYRAIKFELGVSTMKKWAAEFKRGCTLVQDDPREGFWNAKGVLLIDAGQL